jgi:hypothetical protein
VVAQIGGIALFVGLVSGLASRLFFSGAHDARMVGLADRLRIRFWEGWGGRAIAALARLGVHARVASGSSRHTEAVLALAIGDLLKALPGGVRRQFPQLTDVVSHLETERPPTCARIWPPSSAWRRR